jgi:hypothetical protein
MDLRDCLHAWLYFRAIALAKYNFGLDNVAAKAIQRAPQVAI